MSKLDVLVICSTLNQVTNYLMINYFKPKKIYNITYDKDSDFNNLNMKNHEWDIYLKKECENLKYTENDFEDIKLERTDLESLKTLKEKIKDKLSDEDLKKDIFWHITGGQRVLSLAINEIVKERDNDKLLYIEGNTENLIVSDKTGENCNKEKNGEYKYDYRCTNLTFETVLNLTGFRTNAGLKSTDILIGRENENLKKTEEDKAKFKNEHKFYKNLYKKLFEETNREKAIKFRDKLIESNKKNSYKIIGSTFEEINSEIKIMKNNEYNYLADQKDRQCPGGYIFEKITAHRIYEEVKKNSNVIEMATSLKIYFSDERGLGGRVKDEIDIALLTDTGKIIVFECKSGEMSGDNAKSTKYTTYRLSGVFGMPVLLTPLFKSETSSKEKENLKNCYQALRAAETAELMNIPFDKLNKKNLEKVVRFYE